MIYDNPASRLVSILEEGKKKPVESSTLKVWSEILNFERSDSDALMQKIGEVMLLPQKAFALVELYYPQHVKKSEHWRGQIRAAFLHQNLSANWNTFIAHIDDHSISYLSVTADLIQSKISTTLISNEELQNILEDMNDLLGLVLSSEINAKIKLFLSTEIHALISSIQSYRISGAEPILRRAEGMVGHVLVDKDYRDFLTNHAVGQRAVDSLNVMAALLTIATGLPQLSGSIAMLIVG